MNGSDCCNFDARRDGWSRPLALAAPRPMSFKNKISHDTVHLTLPATLENVKVSGILFLTDMLTQEAVISNDEMASALERLLNSNNRLPKKLIKERIDALKRH